MVPQIHIVLATYNGEKYLAEQLDSIVANTYSDISLEICDDCSTDNTIAVAEEYAGRYSWITVHRNEKNLGYAKNFIAGIRRSESPYIMLCDQDDRWNEDKIELTYKKMKELEKNSELSAEKPLLVFTDAMNFDGNTGQKLGSFHKSSHLNVENLSPAHLLMENVCIGCTIMINHAVIPFLEQVPEEIRVHDWWLALICSHFGKINYIAQTTLQYRQHSGNMIGGSDFSNYFKKRISHLKEQREVLEQTFAQGQAFEHIFGGRLQGQEKLVAGRFAQMREAGGLKRRWLVLRYGFLKSGFIRNVALLLIL